MNWRPCVYVAGPMSLGDLMDNVAYGMKVGKRMVVDGFAPYVPMLDAFMHFPDGSYEMLLEWDFAWIARSDALYRLNGASAGADREVEFAGKQGIPVFYQSPETRRHSTIQKDLGYLEMMDYFRLGEVGDYAAARFARLRSTR